MLLQIWLYELPDLGWLNEFTLRPFSLISAITAFLANLIRSWCR
jgi:hypothetical protein